MNNQELTNEERQALIRQLRDSISDLTAYVNMKPEPKDAEDYRWTIKIQEIALAALTAEPVAVRYRWHPQSLEWEEADGSAWGKWKYCEAGMANPHENYERQALFTTSPASVITDSGQMITDSGEMITDKKQALIESDIDNTAQQYEALAGWKMVPVEPTEEMVAAWRKDMNQSYAREFSEKIGEDEVVFAYQAMLEAAPKPEDKR